MALFCKMIPLGPDPIGIIFEFALLAQVGVFEAQEIEDSIKAYGVDLCSAVATTRGFAWKAMPKPASEIIGRSLAPSPTAMV